MPREVDIQQFAERVERVCDFFLSKVVRDGSKNVVILQDLKDDAAILQFDKSLNDKLIDGLEEYVRNVPKES